jgi:putative ABC transport system substrate-binding protein
MPVIGFLGSSSPGATAHMVAAFRSGLREAGYVEGQNVGIVYRYAEGQYDRLPALAAELVRRGVAVIYAVNTANAVQAAKAATSEIPIVFANGIGPSACRGVVRHRHIPSCHHYRVLSTPGPNRSR